MVLYFVTNKLEISFLYNCNLMKGLQKMYIPLLMNDNYFNWYILLNITFFTIFAVSMRDSVRSLRILITRNMM